MNDWCMFSSEELGEGTKIPDKILFSSMCDWVSSLTITPGKIFITQKILYFFVDRKKAKAANSAANNNNNNNNNLVTAKDTKVILFKKKRFQIRHLNLLFFFAFRDITLTHSGISIPFRKFWIGDICSATTHLRSSFRIGLRTSSIFHLVPEKNCLRCFRRFVRAESTQVLQSNNSKGAA